MKNSRLLPCVLLVQLIGCADPSGSVDRAELTADQGSTVANAYAEKHTNTTPSAAEKPEKKEAPKTTSTQSNSFYAQILT